ncbi:MAG TPA: TlpA disulfide reductase family protein [Bryobacteraceae bacterium]|nr:TlpA disulfide reductase family protein [Bryobacteraceae bacterium]
MSKRRFLAPALALLFVAAPAVRAINLPRQSPEFAISLNNGQQVRLSQYKGKVVVLAFILTSCIHCQAIVGYLSQDQNTFGPRGLQVLASAVDDDAAAKVPAFIRQFKPPFPVGFTTNPLAAIDYLEHPPMLTPHMPILAFIDRQGIIRAQYEGDDVFLAEDRREKNLRAKIEELLNQAVPAAKKSVAKKSAPAPKK